MGMAGILFGILFLSLFIGVPIAISLGVAASLTMMLTNNAQYLASIPTRMFTQLDSFTLMAVPFFILAGNIMAEGGISDRLISFFELLLKRLPGRLSCICVVASGFFGAISGSNPATVAAIGGICAPKMIEKGYSREDAAAIAASSEPWVLLFRLRSRWLPTLSLLLYPLLPCSRQDGFQVLC